MGNPRKYSHEPVFVFEIGEEFLFRHYFQGRDVFKRMQRYYNQRKYRFEVPPDQFDAVKSFLDDYGYTLVVVEETDTFVVVVKKYTTYPGSIFKNSVIQRSQGDYNCFLMKDKSAVEQATHNNGYRLTDTSLDNPF